MKDFNNFLEEFRKLSLPDKEYAIFGSGPLAVRGIRKAEDIDVIVTKELYHKLKKKYSEEDERILIGNIEIISPESVIVEEDDEVIERAEKIKGFRFASLKDIIKWKKRMGREKDLKDIKLIEYYLKSSQK